MLGTTYLNRHIWVSLDSSDVGDSCNRHCMPADRIVYKINVEWDRNNLKFK